MKLKIDDKLKKVAAATGCEPMAHEIFADLLCKHLIKANVLKDTPDNYGLSMIEATGKVRVFDVVSALIDYLGVPAISMDEFDAFCRLTVLGDGDCPVCGGELQYFSTEGHEINDGDHLTPNTYVEDGYTYKCRVCGNYLTTDKEL